MSFNIVFTLRYLIEVPISLLELNLILLALILTLSSFAEFVIFPFADNTTFPRTLSVFTDLVVESYVLTERISLMFKSLSVVR